MSQASSAWFNLLAVIIRPISASFSRLETVSFCGLVLVLQMALRVWAVSVGKLHCLNSSRSYFCNCSLQARVSSSQGEGRDAHLSCSVLPLVSLGFGWLLFPNPTTGMLFLRLVWSCAWLPQVDGSWPSCGLGLLGPKASSL